MCIKVCAKRPYGKQGGGGGGRNRERKEEREGEEVREVLIPVMTKDDETEKSLCRQIEAFV